MPRCLCAQKTIAFNSIRAVHAEFISSPSLGGHFHARIRGKFGWRETARETEIAMK
jgi:hypothetical protein